VSDVSVDLVEVLGGRQLASEIVVYILRNNVEEILTR
jgi:hypothetical protein